MIYLDQAATSYPKPTQVHEAVLACLEYGGNSGRGAHDLSLAASRSIFATRLELAEFFGARDPSSIVFTSNATESLNLAIFGTLKSGDHVLTTALEHNSVLRPLYALSKKGVEISILPADRQGLLNYQSLKEYLRPNTKAVITTHASNVTGNLVAVDQIGAFCQEHDLVYIVDAAQTAGWYPYNLASQPIDILCFTGHKALYGPQGVGGIYVKPGILVNPLKVGGSGVQSYASTHPQEMPERLEAGTLNSLGIAGLRAGIRYLKSVGLPEIRRRESQLTQFFIHAIRKIPKIKIYGDFSTFERPPIVSLNLGSLSSGFVSQVLAEEYQIATRPGAHCAPLMHRALESQALGTVRFSFSHLNTQIELKRASEALQVIARKY